MLPEKIPRNMVRIKDFIERYYGLHFIELSGLIQIAHLPTSQLQGIIFWNPTAGIASSSFEFFTDPGVSLILPRRSRIYQPIGTPPSPAPPGMAAYTTKRKDERKEIPKRNQRRMYRQNKKVIVNS
jgi:hypothetical protein